MVILIKMWINPVSDHTWVNSLQKCTLYGFSSVQSAQSSSIDIKLVYSFPVGVNGLHKCSSPFKNVPKPECIKLLIPMHCLWALAPDVWLNWSLTHQICKL